MVNLTSIWVDQLTLEDFSIRVPLHLHVLFSGICGKIFWPLRSSRSSFVRKNEEREDRNHTKLPGMRKITSPSLDLFIFILSSILTDVGKYFGNSDLHSFITWLEKSEMRKSEMKKRSIANS